MVFSSVPVYLDPHNWPQQQPGNVGENNHLLLPVPPISTGERGGTSTVAGSIKPGSMAERARLTRLPQPEAALKCPRCESTNTKFCYFNNYSLSQPRHFCKTCRRYWTRGGALRNVPVGGGCRRNKRCKVRKRMKSPVTTDQPHQAVASSSKSCCTIDMVGNLLLPPPPQVPFLPSLPHLSDYAAGDIGPNFAGIQIPAAAATGGSNGGTNLEFQMGSCSSDGGPVLSRFAEQWRLQQQLQQFPILAGLEPPSRIYPFEGEGQGVDQVGSEQLGSGVSMKMEENQGFNLSRNFLGVQGNINDQYWGSNYAWSTDLSGF